VARRLGVYLTVPFIEKEEPEDRERDERETRYYNAVSLLGPDGAVVAHWRKRNLWPVADASWATAGGEKASIAETELGRIGLMICYDVHVVLEDLGEAGADVVLHSVAWYGPNSGGWFDTVLARKVGEAGAGLVLANWTFPEDPGWSGWGLSRVIGPDGETLARAESDLGDEVVIADLPLR
jgi:predicted amidohydrolase